MAKPLLIDTHALIWWLVSDVQLPKGAQRLLEDGERRVLVSAVSAWEVSIKQSIGKLKAPSDLIHVVEEAGLEWVPIRPAEAYAAGKLPMHHRDPFDRLLIAQTFSRSADILSRDAVFDSYDVSRLWP